ncbi:MAG: 5'-methylthioadenosine/S-adenosylhomocysteine nucleosidase [Clostridia bacterium]|nr:5'-methylthioadenosine/S-adenosylhomocysteine nucleosidase [Clostridia bacterium]
MKIGIVIADEYEYIPFRNYALTKNCAEAPFHGRESLTYTDGEKTVTAVQCGIGKVNAATAAAFLIAEGCEVILSAGLSGAVSGLRRGDMIAAESYVECDFDLTPIGRPLGAKPGQEYVYRSDEKLLAAAMKLDGMKKAPVGTGDLFLTDKEKCALYRDTFGVKAFDMETAAVASVCYFDGIPFLAVRKISDDADDSANADYNEMNDRKEADLTGALARIIAAL